jgi:hypothetical protein
MRITTWKHESNTEAPARLRKAREKSTLDGSCPVPVAYLKSGQESLSTHETCLLPWSS